MLGNLRAGQKYAGGVDCSTGSDVCSTSSLAETDAATKGVVIGVTMMVRHVRADWSRSNYLVKANFRIEIRKAWSHKNAWAPAGTFGHDQFNKKMELTRVILTELNNKLFHTGSNGSLILNVKN